MSKASYNTIDKYVVSAECAGPLHIGGASGDREEVLINPADDTPFIQAAGICGALRGYCSSNKDNLEAVKELFGDRDQKNESRIRVTDGIFTPDTIQIELRPHVKIDPETGTVSAKQLKGSETIQSGQKFDSQYVAAGAKFEFKIYLYDGTKFENKLVLKSLEALKAGEIQFGGQKSSGCGFIKINEILHDEYDMTDKAARTNWIHDESNKLEDGKKVTLEPEDMTNAYKIEITASTESNLLVKGIAVDRFGKEEPKATNIKNGQGQYIVPGSSIRGSVRNRMEMICEYMHLDSSLITDAFGMASETDTTGKTGNLKFQDVIMGDGTKENLQTRIHIDKFTGGVIHSALFSELNISGDLAIEILVANRENPEAVTGLLLLAVRDLGRKLYTLGGGQNVGKGYINVHKVQVTDQRVKNPEKNGTCCLNQDFEITGDQQIIDTCMEKLREMNGRPAVKEE